jgi:hypothetical protein
MRIPNWKKWSEYESRTIWENRINKKRVYVVWNEGYTSWRFGNYEDVNIIFKDTPTKDKNINLSRNKRAAFKYAVKYMREHPK